ncbi:MAG: hypothetical protein KDD47_06495 [Acidobacteria bacterium]|nr:hypothetical protein [Acidobacteriota bacterium]
MKDDSSRLWLRLLSFALAVGLWFAVSLDRPSNQSQRLVEASVTYNTNQNLVLLNPLSRVEVRLQGNEQAVTSLNPQMVLVILDLMATTRAETVEVPLGPENVSIPEGLEVVSVTPSTLNLEFDFRETVQMPVQEVLKGEPAAGARVVARRVTPDQVTATGPRSVFEPLRYLQTEPVDLQGHALTFEETVPVRVPHPLVSIQPPRVKVRIELELDTPTVPEAAGSAESS